MTSTYGLDARRARIALAGIAALVLNPIATAQFAEAPPEAPRESDIAVAELGDGDPLAVGALAPDAGGLPRTLWEGSDSLSAARAMAAAVDAADGRAANALAARVLASGGAAPPAHAGGIAAPLATARLTALAALSRPDAVEAVGSRTPGALRDPALAKLVAQARLALGDADGACAADDLLAPDDIQGWWLRLRGVCLSLAGETAAGDVTLELAADTGVEGADLTLRRWVDAALVPGLAAPDAAPRDALEALLARRAEGALTPEWVEAMPLAAAAGLAVDDATTDPARVAAAVRAARAGVIGPQDLAGAFEAGATNFPGAPADAFAEGRVTSGPMRHALLHRAALGLPDPAQKAEAIALALRAAEADGLAPAAARIYAPELAFLPRQPALTPFAEAFAVASALAEEPGLARAWLRLAEGGPRAIAGPDTLPQDGAAALQDAVEAEAGPRGGDEPLAQTAAIDGTDGVDPQTRLILAVADPATRPDALADALADRLGAPGADRAQALRAAPIIVALGAELRPDLRAAATGAAARGPALDARTRAAGTAMALAADQGALAETGLFGAAFAGLAGLDDAAATAEAVRVLQAVGLTFDARALALDALMHQPGSVEPTDDGEG